MPATALPQTTLRKTRQHLIEHGCCPPGSLDAWLSRSWQRSLAAGLQPSTYLPTPDNLAARALSEIRDRDHDLLAHALPVMEYLLEQVRHSPSIVVLAGACGTIVHTQGGGLFLGKAERVALAAGAAWHEHARGTNAIGTALAEAAPVEVRGPQHYLDRHAGLTCAAAPIFSGSGELLGALDISGEDGQWQPHTLGLVDTAARTIENRLLCRPGQRHWRLHMHTSPQGIGTFAECLLVVSQDGWVVASNRRAREQLQGPHAPPGPQRLEDWLATPLHELLAHQHTRPSQAQMVRCRQGRPWFLLLHASTPRPVGGAAPAPLSAPASASALAPDALSRLCLGDARCHSAVDKTRRILGKSIPLLIQGESGVGKEWLARAAHDSGPRQRGPFVAINCAALPESLIESELFGHAAGAFTGAKREGRTGLLRQAHGGTLFLDEMGDMPLALQSRLLRVLQEREVTPLGANQAVALDVDLICATHRNLADEVQAGRFRADLYYRLHGLMVTWPALRERSDFDALTERLLHSIEPQRTVALAHEVQQALRQHGWPGNLRQYANVLRTACAMLNPSEDTIDWVHLPDDLRHSVQRQRGTGTAAQPAQPMPHNLSELSRTAVQQALTHSRGNVSQAARLLGISRQTLYRKLHTAGGWPAPAKGGDATVDVR